MAACVWMFVETMLLIAELFKGILETNFHKTSQKLNHVIEGVQEAQVIETKFICPMTYMMYSPLTKEYFNPLNARAISKHS